MPKDRNSFKYKVWRIVVSTPFEYFIMMLIVFNTLLLMMKVRISSADFSFVIKIYSYYEGVEIFKITLTNPNYKKLSRFPPSMNIFYSVFPKLFSMTFNKTNFYHQIPFSLFFLSTYIPSSLKKSPFEVDGNDFL